MDYTKLYQSTKEKILTDLVLTLTDNHNQVILHLHKIILYSSCIYFEKILTVLKEKDLNNITIEVPNVYAARDIIMSFYNQPINSSNNKYFLESIKCKYFFGLDFDQAFLDNIQVLEEDFDLFMDVIDLVGYNEETIKLIINNIPEKYDLTKFPKELLSEILTLEKKYDLVFGCQDDSIKIWNVQDNELIDKISNYETLSLCYSSNNKWIASGNWFHSIDVRNTKTHYAFCSIETGCNCVLNLCSSPDCQYIAARDITNSIKVWNINTGALVHDFSSDNRHIMALCFSPDSKHIAATGIPYGTDFNNYVRSSRKIRENFFEEKEKKQINIYHKYIKIWDLRSGKLVHTINGLDDNINRLSDICTMVYSPDNKHIAYGNNFGIIVVHNTNTYVIETKVDAHVNTIHHICYTSDSKLIASASEDTTIKIWHAKTGQLIKTLDCQNDIALYLCYSADDRYLASGHIRNNIKIWDTLTFSMLYSIDGYNTTVKSIYFSSFQHNELIKRIEETIKN